MKKIQLSVFLKINGIGAASGIVYKDNSIFIISDTSSCLYEYKLDGEELSKIQLLDDIQENSSKKNKPDFEAITLFKNKLYILGSGSTDKRNKQVTYYLISKKTKSKNLSKIYQKLQNSAMISSNDLNIEGIIITDEKRYFFQRGNSENSRNGVFIYEKKTKNIQFISIHLPKIKDIEATFTDAILVNDKIYFLAAIENTTSTYNDGEILGSFIGCMDFKTFEVNFIHQISDSQKFEGLTLFTKTEKQMEFLLCEDNDTEGMVSTIYKLTLC